jgi:hypothetical protein
MNPMIDQGDENLRSILYKVAKCWKMKEVPLMIVAEKDQPPFVNWAPSLFNGTVIYSTAPDAAAQLLKSIQQLDYLFVIVEDILEDELLEVLDYYLDSRDVLGAPAPPDKFVEHPVHADHALLLLMDRVVLDRQPLPNRERLIELCTNIFVS